MGGDTDLPTLAVVAELVKKGLDKSTGFCHTLSMANVMRTERTFKTVENATKFLAKVLTTYGHSKATLESERWLIAVVGERFAPVLVGVKYIEFIHAGVTVVG